MEKTTSKHPAHINACPVLSFFLFFLLFFLPVMGLSAQSVLPGIGYDGTILYPERAPQALLEFSLEDSEVDFFLLGSWEAKLGFAAGLSWIPQHDGSYIQQEITPATLRSTPLTNVVDLVTSLIIDDSFFFESTFHSGFADSSILFGYYGEGLLREFKFGNTDIGIQEYPFLRTGAGITGSPGIAATLATNSTLHEFVLRYETTSEVRRSFIGNSEYISNNREIQDFVAGKYFLLPDRNPENLKVWLEEGRGSFGAETVSDTAGTRYRLLRPTVDYGILADRGELSINSSLPVGRILVHYSVNGTALSADSHSGEIPISRLKEDLPGVSKEALLFTLRAGGGFERHFVEPLNALLGFSTAQPGISLSDYSRVIDGNTALVLYDPELFSPFEIQAYYRESSKVEDIQLGKGSNTDNSVSFRSADGTVQIISSTPVELLSEPWKIRYPLASVDNGALQSYGPGAVKKLGNPSIHSLFLQFRSLIGEGIRIEDTIVPGTLLVYRNSALVSDFKLIDGLLILPRPVAPLDRILVVYRVPDNSGRLGNVSAATGHRFFLLNGDNIELALDASIGITEQKAGREPGGNPAHIQLSTAYNIEKEEITTTIEAALGYSVADTYESFEPARTASKTTTLGIHELSLLPSPAPDTGHLQTAYGLPPSVRNFLPPLHGNNRGEQLFRNFREGDRGTVLPRNAYAGKAEPEALSTAIGPYPVLSTSNDKAKGRLAALEFRTAMGEWAGYQIRTGAAELTGFIRGLELSVFPESLTQPVHVFLQAGELGEDIDGDFILDSQQRPEDRGLPFSKGAVDRYAGYPGRSYHENWRGITEDTNNNGRLDSDNPAAMLSIYLGTLSSSDLGNWKTLRHDLRAIDSNRIAKGMAMRVIVVSEHSSEGRIFFGNHKIHQSDVLVTGNSARLTKPADNPTQYTLRWSAPPQSENSPQEIRMPLASTSNGLYRNLSIQFNSKDMGGDETIQLGINGNEIARIPIHVEDAWKTLRIGFDSQTVTILHANNSEYSAAFASPVNEGLLEYISLKISPSNSGSLQLRAPVFSESQGRFSGGGKIDLLWTPESAMLMENTVLQTGIESLQFNTSLFSPGFTDTQGIDSSIRIGGSLPLFLTTVFFRVYWDFDNDLRLDASHGVSLHSVPGIGLRNNFSQKWQEQAKTAEISQDIELILQPFSWFSLEGTYSLIRLGTVQNRDWGLGLDLGEDLFLRTSIDLELNEGKIADPLSNPSYFGNYIDSIRHIDWGLLTSPRFKRSADLYVGAGLNHENFSLKADAELLTEYDSLNVFSENFIQTIELGFFADSGLYVIVDGGQHFFHQGNTHTEGFFEQIATLFRHAGSEPYFLAPIYIGGIFSEEAAESFFRSAGNVDILGQPLRSSQEYRTGITFRRRLGSLVSDLLLPSGVSFNVNRKLEWKQGLASDTRSLESTVSWQAINLFGTRGRSPLFSGYASDEIYMDIEYKQSLHDSEDWNIGGEFSPSFFNAPPFSEIKNSFDWKWTALGESSIHFAISTSLIWDSILDLDLGNFFDRFNVEKKELGMRHEEAVKISFNGLRGNSRAGSFSSTGTPGLTIELGHSTSLLFADVGAFSLDFAIVYSNEALKSQDYAYAHRIGFELNATLELSY